MTGASSVTSARCLKLASSDVASLPLLTPRLRHSQLEVVLLLS